MNKGAKLLAVGAVTLALSSPALAMQTAEELTGKEIRNLQGEEIGTVEEVLINAEGNVDAVVIEKGGFFGIGGEDRRIDWNNLSQSRDREYLIYAEQGGGQQQITAKPALGNDTIPRSGGESASADSGQAQKTQAAGQSGKEADLAAGQDSQQSGKSGDKVASAQQDQQSGSSNTEWAAGQNRKVREDSGDQMAAQEDQRRGGEKDGGQLAANSRGQSPEDEKIDAGLAALIQGSEVVGKNGESLGKVDQFVFSEMQSNSVRYLLIKGEDDTLHPLPVQMVRVKRDGGKVDLRAQVDKQTFANAPAIERGEIMQLSREEQSRQIESYYGISPAWKGDVQKSSSDNAARQDDQAKQGGEQRQEATSRSLNGQESEPKQQ